MGSRSCCELWCLRLRSCRSSPHFWCPLFVNNSRSLKVCVLCMLRVFVIVIMYCVSEDGVTCCISCLNSNWKKLRKSLVKPVRQQNISSCLVLPPEIVMHDALNVLLWTSADICVDIIAGFLPRHWFKYEWFLSAENVHRYMCRAWRSRWKYRTTRYNRFWRANCTTNCSRLEYVDIRSVY